MKRYFFVIGALAILVVSPLRAITVPKEIVVSGSHIKLSDIFYGLEKKGHTIVGLSPGYGQKLTFSASFLKKIAHKFHIDWKPTEDDMSVNVIRGGHIITREEIAQRIKPLLEERLRTPHFKIVLDKKVRPITLSNEQPLNLQLDSVTLNYQQDHFTARLFLPGYAVVEDKTYALSGKILTQVLLPVLKNTIGKDHLITKEDLTWIAIDSAKLKPHIVTSEQQLIGSTPKNKLLKANALIKKNDLQLPFIVKKGALVTLFIETPTLFVTCKGKALENGSLDKMIKVKNSKTNKIIEGKVAASGHVRVALPKMTG